MTLLLIVLALATALAVILVTCVQLLYLESLRIRSREIPALQFFKEVIEPKIGLETERGALTFSLVKHVGLAILGCLILAITLRNAPLWEALAGACLLSAIVTIIGVHLIPHLVYRKGSAGALVALVPILKLLALLVRPLTWSLEFLRSLFNLNGSQPAEDAPRPEQTIEALIDAGEEEGIIEKGDRELIQSVVAFGGKTVRQVLTARPDIVAIPQEATLEELRQLVITEQYSRIPAYDGDIDAITGFVHVRGTQPRAYRDANPRTF
jgi:CBS domain containing-hemolysin-like protein